MVANVFDGMAALAGSWTAFAAGWAGLAVASGALHFHPRSAPKLTHYALQLNWRGSTLAPAVGPEDTTYTRVAGAPVALFDHGRALTIAAEPVFAPALSLKALIFDLDGVLNDTAEDHCATWGDLARRHGFTFDRAFNEHLKTNFDIEQNGAPTSLSKKVNALP